MCLVSSVLQHRMWGRGLPLSTTGHGHPVPVRSPPFTNHTPQQITSSVVASSIDLEGSVEAAVTSGLS